MIRLGGQSKATTVEGTSAVTFSNTHIAGMEKLRPRDEKGWSKIT